MTASIVVTGQTSSDSVTNLPNVRQRLRCFRDPSEDAPESFVEVSYLRTSMYRTNTATEYDGAYVAAVPFSFEEDVATICDVLIRCAEAVYQFLAKNALLTLAPCHHLIPIIYT